MDSAAYLQRYGWRGTGHSLDATNNGLKRPLLISKKVDVLGIGINKHDISDQWWMRAFDSSLKDFGTGNKGLLGQVKDHGIKRGGLYGRFVKGEGVPGTLEEPNVDIAQSQAAAPNGSTLQGVHDSEQDSSDEDSSEDSSEEDSEDISDADSSEDDSSEDDESTPETTDSDTSTHEADAMPPPKDKKRKAEGEAADDGENKKPKMNPERQAMLGLSQDDAAATSDPKAEKKLSYKAEKYLREKQKRVEKRDARDKALIAQGLDPIKHVAKGKAEATKLKGARKAERTAKRQVMLASKAERLAEKAKTKKLDRERFKEYLAVQGGGGPSAVPRPDAKDEPAQASTDEQDQKVDTLAGGNDFISLGGAPAGVSATGGKPRKIPGVGVVAKYPTKAEKRATKTAAEAFRRGVTVEEVQAEIVQARADKAAADAKERAEKKGLNDLSDDKRARYEERAHAKGVSLEQYYLGRVQKNAKAKVEAHGAKTTTAAAAEPQAAGDLGFVVDTTGAASAPSAQDGPVPLDPSIWAGRVVKKLTKGERRARRDWIAQERERKRREAGRGDAHPKGTRAERKIKDQEKLMREILLHSRGQKYGAGSGGGGGAAAAADGAGEGDGAAAARELPVVPVASKQGGFDKGEVKAARRAARRVIRHEKQSKKGRAEKLAKNKRFKKGSRDAKA